MSKLKEECGVFGIIDLDGNSVSKTIYYGLIALQHRGQESCGIVTVVSHILELSKLRHREQFSQGLRLGGTETEIRIHAI